jgi:hypothetical protein
VTNAWLTMALWPVRPLGRRGRSGQQGCQGRGRARKGSPFHQTHPGLIRCNDFKDASKAAPLLLPSREALPLSTLSGLCGPLVLLQPKVHTGSDLRDASPDSAWRECLETLHGGTPGGTGGFAGSPSCCLPQRPNGKVQRRAARTGEKPVVVGFAGAGCGIPLAAPYTPFSLVAATTC